MHPAAAREKNSMILDPNQSVLRCGKQLSCGRVGRSGSPVCVQITKSRLCGCRDPLKPRSTKRPIREQSRTKTRLCHASARCDTAPLPQSRCWPMTPGGRPPTRRAWGMQIFQCGLSLLSAPPGGVPDSWVQPLAFCARAHDDSTQRCASVKCPLRDARPFPGRQGSAFCRSLRFLAASSIPIARPETDSLEARVTAGGTTSTQPRTHR